MGNIFGVVGALIPIIVGIYCILYFGGYKTPKSKDTAALEKFENTKTKHGKKLIFMGVFLVLYGLFNLRTFF